MRVSIASESGRPDGRNEDWAGATAQLAVVLDGLSEAAETGCRHGTPWYVHQLGCLLLRLAGDPGRPLTESLAEAIDGVTALHRDSCDLDHPGSPCSTVAMVRRGAESLDYLVLSDSVVVLDRIGSEPLVVQDRAVESFAPAQVRAALAADDRHDTAALFALIREQQRVRNRPEGYWVAQSAPEAAQHARCGTVDGARGAVLLSDGAARPVTDFDAMDWPALLALCYARGPEALIAVTRELEDHDPHGVVWPRYKHRDDATAVVCRW